MITSDEAEERAQALVKQFVKDAGCEDMHDVTNVLGMLASVAGMSMMEAAGRGEAVRRMSEVTAHVMQHVPRAQLSLVPPAGLH